MTTAAANTTITTTATNQSLLYHYLLNFRYVQNLLCIHSRILYIQTKKQNISSYIQAPYHTIPHTSHIHRTHIRIKYF